MQFEQKPKTLGDVQDDQKKDPPQDPTNSNLRTHITYILVAAWIIIVLGKAFGFVDQSIEIDALLIGSLGVAFGYLYGQTVQPRQ